MIREHASISRIEPRKRKVSHRHFLDLRLLQNPRKNRKGFMSIPLSLTIVNDILATSWYESLPPHHQAYPDRYISVFQLVYLQQFAPGSKCCSPIGSHCLGASGHNASPSFRMLCPRRMEIDSALAQSARPFKCSPFSISRLTGVCPKRVRIPLWSTGMILRFSIQSEAAMAKMLKVPIAYFTAG